MYSSTAGLVPSLAIAAVVLVLSWYVLAYVAHFSESGTVLPSHAFGFAAVAFSAAFAVLNLVVQWNVVTGPFLHEEVANGALALRVISVTAVPTFVLLVRVALEQPKFVVATDLRPRAFTDTRNQLREYERQLGRWPVGTAVSQATVLVLVLCVLWDLQIRRQDSLSIALLNWSFVLTADVVFTAASYRAERAVLPTTYHAMLVVTFGAITFGLLCSVAVEGFAWWLAVLMIFLVVFFLVLPGIYRVANRGLVALMKVGELFESDVDLEDVPPRGDQPEMPDRPPE